ncbi:uncharacterized protein MONBRDRAFT_34044 [Monosiga brevicollis MX1]|uniref:PIN domain-containing protein n=1 Tax=Monosiga brevicollis TaxID=81824 RepID=A9V9J3_MONBE|nr:uncharacterized protein MONBRDRAFT_34044 [Monosiga brevicollis MX1]EDQ85805.1 predicted protein [Monosiga brevicollis MX1]|eukprot:XP_001749284.1 hypothetical protein [Monosiga brevicollis MX1]
MAPGTPRSRGGTPKSARTPRHHQHQSVLARTPGSSGQAPAAADQSALPAAVPYVVFDVYHGKLTLKVSKAVNCAKIAYGLSQALAGDSASPRPSHGASSNFTSRYKSEPKRAVRLAADWVHQKLYLGPDEYPVKLQSIRHDELTVEAMAMAAQQIHRALAYWEQHQGLQPVIRLIQQQTHPIWEIHLSHNNITRADALLAALAERNWYPYQASSKKPPAPLWLRLECNRLDADAVQRTCRRLKLSYCIPASREQCAVSLHCTYLLCNIKFAALPISCYNVGSAPAPFHKPPANNGSDNSDNSDSSDSSDDSDSDGSADSAHGVEQTKHRHSNADNSISDDSVTHDHLKQAEDDHMESMIDRLAATSLHDQDASASRGPVESTPSPATTYVVLDTSALIGMLRLGLHAAKSKSSHARPNHLFTFETLLQHRAACQGQLLLIIPHTVGIELDAQKGNTKLSVLENQAIRGFLAEYGLRQQCVAANILLELSKEDAELDIIQTGALKSLHLHRADEMIVNVALHLRRAILRGVLDECGEDVEAINQADRRCLLLLTEDQNMMQRANQAGVPAAKFSSLNDEFEHGQFTRLRQGDAQDALWAAAGPRAARTADDDDLIREVTRKSASDDASTGANVLTQAQEWLALVADLLPVVTALPSDLAMRLEDLGGAEGVAAVMEGLRTMQAQMQQSAMAAVMTSDPRFSSHK